MEARWRIELLGGLRAAGPRGGVTRFRTQKTAALLAYLALNPRPHSREELVELFWPEVDLSAGRASLTTALTSLRQDLEGSDAEPRLILADRQAVRLNPAVVVTDVGEFETLLRRSDDARAGAPAELLGRAVELYRGPLLPGSYDEWALAEQQRLAALFLVVLGQLADCLESAGDAASALSHAARAVSADPLAEAAHRRLIRLYLATGQPSAAVRQYRELEQILRGELRTAPTPATLALVAPLLRNGDATAKGAAAAPAAPAAPAGAPVTGGALPPGSLHYLARACDHQVEVALAQRESILLVNGPPQTGKSSLAARALRLARDAGFRVVLTDLRKLNVSEAESAAQLFLQLADALGEQLRLHVEPASLWSEHRAPSVNFERFLRREVMAADPRPVLWVIDEADRLFLTRFGIEVFRLFRAWHNERAMDPAGPWSRLVLAIVYATEAHLFIKDLNQSPFNVGTRITLGDFSTAEIARVNQRLGQPLRDPAELHRLAELVGGNPFLIVRSLSELGRRGAGIDWLEAEAGRDDGIFGDHLASLHLSLRKDPDLLEAMHRLLKGRALPTAEQFFRLRTAGVVSGGSERDARVRCRLYALYLERHLT